MRLLAALPILFLVNMVSAEPVLFDQISLLCTVPEIDFYDPSEVDYAQTEDFIGCDPALEITGTGGLVEVFYGVPEGGGPETAFPPLTISGEMIAILARIGTATYFDFDPAPAIFAAHSTNAGRAVVLCSDGSTRLVPIDPGIFALDCNGYGLERWRWITRPNESVNLSTLSAIEVPEPTVTLALWMVIATLALFTVFELRG